MTNRTDDELKAIAKTACDELEVTAKSMKAANAGLNEVWQMVREGLVDTIVAQETESCQVALMKVITAELKAKMPVREGTAKTETQGTEPGT